MKKIIFTAVFIGLGSASAFAADVASRSYTQAPSAAPTGSWSGFYVGGHVGGLWTSSDAAWDPLPSPAFFGINPIAGTLKGSSAAGGLHAGYNWQFAPTLLAGLEGDWTWTKPSGSFTQPWILFATGAGQNGAFTTMSRAADWLASVRAPLGILLTPNVLAYATGGVAWGKFDYAANNTNGATYNTSAAFSDTSAGYLVGGGLEWSMTHNWFLTGEDLFYRLNTSRSVVATAAVAPNFPSGYAWSDTNISEARLGLSYKF